MGFDYFYGFIGGDTSQWQPGPLFRNTTPIYPYVGNPELQPDHRDGRRRDRLHEPGRRTLDPGPAVLRLLRAGRAPTRRTIPTKEWVDKISAMHLFDDGWNKLRDTIFANQKRLGVIPENAELTPWPDDLLKNWDSSHGGREEALHPAGRRLRAPISPTPTTRSAG